MKYRILHLVTSRQRRGAEIFALQLAQSLDPERFESVFCFVFESVGIATDGFDSYCLSSAESINSISLIRTTARLRGLLRSIKPDLVLAHGSATLRHAGLLRLFSTRPKLIYRNIGLASYWVKGAIQKSFYQLLAKRVDAVVSLSQLTRMDFIHQYGTPSGRAFVIPNGVDTSPFDSLDRDEIRAAKRLELGLATDDEVLITVGSLSLEKNHVAMIDMIRDLHQKSMRPKLLIVGEGPLRSEIESRIEAFNLSPHVLLMGERTDIPELLVAADLFVLTSFTESMPAVVIEAGFAGLPAITYNVGGLSELVYSGTTGYLIDGGNQDAFTDAVLHLLNDPNQRIAMGESAQKAYRERFDIKRVAGHYENLFLNLMAQERSQV